MKQDQIEKLVDKAQNLWDTGVSNITPLPDPDENGMIHMKYQELRRLMKERQNISWASGVFDAIARL